MWSSPVVPAPGPPPGREAQTPPTWPIRRAAKSCSCLLYTSLPHANAGALDGEDLARLRTVTASQGMMIESVNPDLAAHRSAPDKTPERRLATLEAAGVAHIPFTTGLLVGIGESRADRLDTLTAIAASHRRHGHVQEAVSYTHLDVYKRQGIGCATAPWPGWWPKASAG